MIMIRMMLMTKTLLIVLANCMWRIDHWKSKAAWRSKMRLSTAPMRRGAWSLLKRQCHYDHKKLWWKCGISIAIMRRGLIVAKENITNVIVTIFGFSWIKVNPIIIHSNPFANITITTIITIIFTFIFLIIIISIIWCNLKEDVVAACAVETTGRRCQHPLNSPPCICISNWTSYLYFNSYLNSYFNSTLCSAQRRGKCRRLLNLHLLIVCNLSYN